MALYSREQTKSFFSEIAHEQDTCFYCEKSISEKRQANIITRDEAHKELRLLRGKLTGKRVMKFRYMGHEFCVCPTCVKSIYAEICPADCEKSVISQETVVEPVAEDTTSTKTKSKSKGKENATK